MEGNEKSKSYDIDSFLRRRNNLFKWIFGFIVLGFIGVMIFTDRITVDFSSFSFSDFIAIIVSLWAMYISILFYHENQKQASNFYDRFYTFIKDVSVSVTGLEQSMVEKFSGLKKSVDDGFSNNNPKLLEKTDIKALESQKKDLEASIENSKKELEQLALSQKTPKGNKEISGKISKISDDIIDSVNKSSDINRTLREYNRYRLSEALIKQLITNVPENQLREIFRFHRSSASRELTRLARNIVSKDILDQLDMYNVLKKESSLFGSAVFRELSSIYAKLTGSSSLEDDEL